MIGVPAATAFDLRFRLLGLPVRISPWFWLLALFLTWGDGSDLSITLVGTACVLVSILVHEFGHGLSSRMFGRRVDEVILYQVGGLCVHEPVPNFWQNLFVVAAGPGIGLILGAVCLALRVGLEVSRAAIPYQLEAALGFLIFINIGWSLLNLLPVWPLDGGQILGLILGRAAPRNGRRWTHIVGLLVAGIISCIFFTYQLGVFGGIMFALIAFDNFQVLQVMHHWSKAEDGDDGDWWKR
jgi:Zn-dependent protease